MSPRPLDPGCLSDEAAMLEDQQRREYGRVHRLIYPSPAAISPTPRYCRCGCMTPLSGRQVLWAGDACRVAFKRRRERASANRKRTRGAEQPRLRFELALAAAREAAAGRDPEAALRARLTERQRAALAQWVRRRAGA